MHQQNIKYAFRSSEPNKFRGGGSTAIDLKIDKLNTNQNSFTLTNEQ